MLFRSVSIPRFLLSRNFLGTGKPMVALQNQTGEDFAPFFHHFAPLLATLTQLYTIFRNSSSRFAKHSHNVYISKSIFFHPFPTTPAPQVRQNSPKAGHTSPPPEFTLCFFLQNSRFCSIFVHNFIFGLKKAVFRPTPPHPSRKKTTRPAPW